MDGKLQAYDPLQMLIPLLPGPTEGGHQYPSWFSGRWTGLRTRAPGLGTGGTGLRTGWLGLFYRGQPEGHQYPSRFSGRLTGPRNGATSLGTGGTGLRTDRNTSNENSDNFCIRTLILTILGLLESLLQDLPNHD
jgi:hypothetical protein